MKIQYDQEDYEELVKYANSHPLGINGILARWIVAIVTAAKEEEQKGGDPDDHG